MESPLYWPKEKFMTWFASLSKEEQRRQLEVLQQDLDGITQDEDDDHPLDTDVWGELSDLDWGTS